MPQLSEKDVVDFVAETDQYMKAAEATIADLTAKLAGHERTATARKALAEKIARIMFEKQIGKIDTQEKVAAAAAAYATEDERLFDAVETLLTIVDRQRAKIAELEAPGPGRGVLEQPGQPASKTAGDQSTQTVAQRADSLALLRWNN